MLSFPRTSLCLITYFHRNTLLDQIGMSFMMNVTIPKPTHSTFINTFADWENMSSKRYNLILAIRTSGAM